MAHTGELLQTERCGFFVLAPGNRLRLIAHLNFSLLESRGVAFDASELRSPLRLPVARRRCVEAATEVEPADEEVFRRWGIAVAVGMQARDGEIIGFLVCGPKRSGLRYTAEDLDLLGAAGIQAGLAIERLRLSERLAREHAEAARLERLSTLKSYVVSSVSHDLRTPLTSIKMFAELLRTRESLPAGTAGEYLEIIEGETDRLTRIVTQVLDAASLERGAMEFHRRPVDLNASVRNALRTMAYELRAGRCACETSLAPGTLMIEADEDAVARALVNVIANAVRYAAAEKRVSIATAVRSGAAAVEVRDNGIGIGEAEAPRVFEPFFRGGAARLLAAEGAGLGLTIVREIVDAHGGSVAITAAPGGGTVVTLLFPTGPTGPTGDAHGQTSRH
jgi:signal transduction histidine kinase